MLYGRMSLVITNSRSVALVGPDVVHTMRNVTRNGISVPALWKVGSRPSDAEPSKAKIPASDFPY